MRSSPHFSSVSLGADLTFLLPQTLSDDTFTLTKGDLVGVDAGFV